MDNLRVYILNPKLEEVSEGSTGELYVGGIGLSRGYLHRPALTAERFIPNAFATADTPGGLGGYLYRTGDLCRMLPDGVIDFVDRVDNQVKIGGIRIELGEIEFAIAKYPGVKECVVLARNVRGGKGKQLVAYYTNRDSAPINKGALREHLDAELPGFMMPSHLVELAALPLTPNGKVDRNNLPDPLSAAASSTEFVSARNAIEQKLVEAWSEVLHVEKDKLSINANFFELGGDSIDSIQIAARAHRQGLRVHPNQLQRFPTIAALSEHVVEEDPADFSTETRSVKLSPEAKCFLQDSDTEDVYPLTPVQEGMLFHYLLDPHSEQYITQIHWTLTAGGFDINVFRDAWEGVVKRHGVFRTRFAWENQPVPLQIVQKNPPITWVSKDLLHIDDLDTRKLEVEAWMSRDRIQGFDLTTAPLIRFAMFRTDDTVYEFVWTFHHIIIDGWSTAIAIKEWLEGFLNHWAVIPAPVPTTPFREFVAWLRSQDFNDSKPYWKNTLKGFYAPTPLPGATSTNNANRYKRYGHRIPSEDWSRITGFSAEHQITTYTLLQAVWSLLLSMYSRDEDVVYGATVSGRAVPEITGIESMVGMLINTIPVRVGVKSKSKLIHWLRAIQQQQFDSMPFQFTPLVQIQSWSEAPKGTPLFDTLLVLENYPEFGVNLSANMLKPNLPDLVFDVVGVEIQELGNFPLSIVGTFSPETGQMELAYFYDTGRYSDSAIERLSQQFNDLLFSMAECDPDNTLVSQVPAFDRAQRELILLEWTDTFADFPSDRMVHQLVEDQATLTPDAVAIVIDDDNVTYGELNSRANQVAHWLRVVGVEYGNVVAVSLERSTELLVCLLGIQKAGAVYVPIDPAYPEGRQNYIIKDSNASLIITNHRLGSGKPFAIPAVHIDILWERISALESSNLDLEMMPQMSSYMIYTSGTTGLPKGVIMPHEGLVCRLAWLKSYMMLTDFQVLLQTISVSFDPSIYELLSPLVSGSRVVLADPTRQGDVDYLANTIEMYCVNIVENVPTLLGAFLQRTQSDVSCLQTVISGGEALSSQIRDMFYARLGHQTTLYNAYGPTEVCMIATINDCAARGDRAFCSIGRPLSNVQAYVLSPHMELLPVGAPGELFLGGVGLAHGYLGQASLTADRFIPNPFGTDGSRIYRTGDLVSLADDGSIDFIGRVDLQVKVRGYRIELAEIEATLSRHPALIESVVVVKNISDSKQLICYYITNDETIHARALRQFLKDQLPSYMVPSQFVKLGSIPRTSNGKVDAHALPNPTVSRPDLDTAYAPPRNEVESTLANIWKEVLRVPDVGIHDNFFELGGDSIISIQVVSRASQAGIKITTKQLYKFRTIAELVQATGQESLVPVAVSLRASADQGLVTGDLTLTPVHHWFFEQSLKHRSHFNQAVALTISTDVPHDHIKVVMAALTDHHDMLRVRAPKVATRTLLISPDTPSSVNVSSVDMRNVSAEELTARMEKLANTVQSSLNVVTGPIIAAVDVIVANGLPRTLIIVAHHFAIDAVSWRIFMEDFSHGLHQLRDGKSVSLPPKTTSFKLWASKLGQYGQEFNNPAVLNYWRSQLERAASQPSLAREESSSTFPTFGSLKSITVVLGKTHTQALFSKVLPAFHAEMNDVLLTCFALAFADVLKRDSFAFTLEAHGREDIIENADISRTLGWFTTIFPVALSFAGVTNSDVGSALKAVKEQLRKLPARGFSYGVLRHLNKSARDTLLSVENGEKLSSEVSFNYFGQLDSAVADGML
jgi:amino acid adenylation domain-containing protein